MKLVVFRQGATPEDLIRLSEAVPRAKGDIKRIVATAYLANNRHLCWTEKTSKAREDGA